MDARRPLFVFDGVSLRVGDRILFRNTHWTYERSHHWALVGRNGSGKTLLARALAGEVPVIGGEIRYGVRIPPGRVPEDAVVLVSFERHKAVAGDGPAAVRWYSVEQTAAPRMRQFLSQDSIEDINPFEVVTRSRRSTAEFARRRRQVLHWLGIAELMDRHLPSLSSGEMRKTLLAHALLRRPRLLILDDVFTGLDPGFRVHLKRLLENLIRRGDVHLLLTVSHPDELPRGITHMLCVDRCRVVAHGTRAQMLRHDRVRELFRGDGASLRGPRRVPAARRRARPGGSEELVRLENVSVRYDGRAILDKVDWTIRRGESWALTGPNGSGKSTLLSLINGDNPQAYANHVHVFGRRRGSGESVWQLKKRIGWVSPELHLHFPQAQSVLAAVASGFQDSEGCYRRPSSRQRRAARRCLASLGLGDCGELPFGLLSAGLQRVALLARALVKSPDLLVLDEPCHGLDVAHRTRFVQTIEKLLRDTATTVIYVTHRSDEIPRGIRLFLRLRAGQVVHRGSRAEC